MMGGESELRSHNLWEWEPFPAQFRMKELNYNATNVPVGMGTVPRSVPNERTEGSLLGRASLIYMYPTSFVQEWTLTRPQYRPPAHRRVRKRETEVIRYFSLWSVSNPFWMPSALWPEFTEPMTLTRLLLQHLRRQVESPV